MTKQLVSRRCIDGSCQRGGSGVPSHKAGVGSEVPLRVAGLGSHMISAHTEWPSGSDSSKAGSQQVGEVAGGWVGL